MRILLKDYPKFGEYAGKWVAVETKSLFNNQYNAVEVNLRIMDSDVQAVEDDARINKGRCKYCGKLIEKGEEEKHYTESENKKCEACFWYRDKLINTEKRKEQDETTNIHTTIIVETYKKECSYNERCGDSKGADCTNKECRQRGIDWFSPENTFFLKYPKGAASIPIPDMLGTIGFLEENRINRKYCKLIGSYELTACLNYVDGKPVSISHFELSNRRQTLRFIFDFDKREYIEWKYGEPKTSKKALTTVPQNVYNKVFKILEAVNDLNKKEE